MRKTTKIQQSYLKYFTLIFNKINSDKIRLEINKENQKPVFNILNKGISFLKILVLQDFFTINLSFYKIFRIIVFCWVFAFVKTHLDILILPSLILIILSAVFTLAFFCYIIFIKNNSLKKYTTLISSIILFSFSISLGQTADSIPTPSLTLRPLSELTDAAIQNAPDLKNNQLDFAKQNLTLRLQKRSWLDNISVSTTSLFGNGSIVDASNTGTSTAFATSDRQSVNYNLGFGIRVTGGDVFNRNTKIEIQRLQLDRIQNERQFMENRIRETVLEIYSELELALKVVKLRGEVVENQRMTLTIAEKYFKEGNFKPSEYSGMLDKITGAQEQYEQAKAEAKKLALLLKNITNVSVWE
jgi:Outer membrane efflux protein